MVSTQEELMSGAGEGARTIIDRLLAEQRELTAVETFARAHGYQDLPGGCYRNLLPLSAPKHGEQYAFEVELDKCSGCKACVTACHSLNGLDDGELWRDVGMLVSHDWRRPLQQFVTTACHHCVDPACLNGCPVLAYEKDALTGIVRHLDDQCIGCQYCMLMCPYDVPKYSGARGIVRKCDMCSQRLASNEAPACVQACPNEAIRITNIRQQDIRSIYSDGSEPFLPAAPDPGITLPTTRYMSRAALRLDLIPANAADLKLQPPHWPLIIMLVGTQLGAGVFALLMLLPGLLQPPAAGSALAVAAIGLGASLVHLGKPLKAWRSFLGLRRSWLSREIATFGGFAVFATGSTILICARHPYAPLLSVMAAMAGLIGVYCSARIYDATQRPMWRGIRSIGKFFGSAAMLGLAASWVVSAFLATDVAWLPITLAFVTTLKLAGEHRLLRRAEEPVAEQSWPSDGDFCGWSLAQSARLMRERLGFLTRLRFACGIVGGVLLPLTTVIDASHQALLAALSLLLCLIGELMERHAFFRAVVPPRMPGVS